ncbi:MAG: GNAT family N-acetyltransferase [Bacilli bacterium]|nr:GNAT family N-acetyltransferase [Bacilli bacterium]
MGGFERLERFTLSDLRYVFLSNAIHNVYLAPGDNSLQYPGYDHWFYRKNIPRVLNGTGEIIFYADGPVIAGFVSLKKDDELKICTIMVREEYRRMGLGTRLFIDSCEALGTSTPMWTVSEERLKEFKHIIEKFGWKITKIIYDYNSPEYVINGPQEIIVSPQSLSSSPKDLIIDSQSLSSSPKDLIIGSQGIISQPQDIIVGRQKKLVRF